MREDWLSLRCSSPTPTWDVKESADTRRRQEKSGRPEVRLEKSASHGALSTTANRGPESGKKKGPRKAKGRRFRKNYMRRLLCNTKPKSSTTPNAW